jgi:hypothetical protein
MASKKGVANKVTYLTLGSQYYGGNSESYALCQLKRMCKKDDQDLRMLREATTGSHCGDRKTEEAQTKTNNVSLDKPSHGRPSRPPVARPRLPAPSFVQHLTRHQDHNRNTAGAQVDKSRPENLTSGMRPSRPQATEGGCQIFGGTDSVVLRAVVTAPLGALAGHRRRLDASALPA